MTIPNASCPHCGKDLIKQELISMTLVAKRFGVSRALPYLWAELGYIEAVRIKGTGKKDCVRAVVKSVEAFAKTFQKYKHKKSIVLDIDK